MTDASQQIAAIARRILNNEQLIPDHRHAMRSVGGLVTFHHLLSYEIETQSRRMSSTTLTWRQVAAELVDDDAQAWAMVRVPDAGHIIEDVAHIVGRLWVINAERSARVELKPSAAAARAKALRAQTAHDAALVLEKARNDLRIVAREHDDLAIRTTVSELLQETPTFEAIVAAAKLLGERVGIYYRP